MYKFSKVVFSICLLLFLSAIATSASSKNSNSHEDHVTPGSGATPNIIFFLLDDFGYGDISAFGAEYETPNLDDYYYNSIDLRSHYIGLKCSVSRSQILTGRYAWNFGLSAISEPPFDVDQFAAFPAGVPSIGNLFKEYTSYDTYVVGKWHAGYSTWEHTPLYRGFDHFYGFYGPEIWYTNKTHQLFGGPAYIDWRKDDGVDWETQYTYSTWHERDRLLDIIDGHTEPASNPFYVYAALQAPHSELQYVSSENGAQCDDVPDKHNRKLYCYNILAVDQAIGEIVEALKTNDIWDDTLIVFSSDNGGNYHAGACNSPLRGGKGGFFEGGIRTVAWVGGGYIPQSEKGWKRTGLMHGADWTPTLLSLAGVDINQVDRDLKKKLYYPILLNSNSHPNINSSLGDGGISAISNSFDGYDLSRWLIYGNENDNIRTSVGLCINYWNSTLTPQDLDPIALVFNSSITNHNYKMIYGYAEEGNANYCQYCERKNGNKYRCEKEANLTGTYFLYDLTLDFNETTNLWYNSTLLSVDKDEANEFNKWIEINNRSEEYQEKQKQTLLVEDVDRMVHAEVNDVWDYFMYGDGANLVNRLWREGKNIAVEFTENEFFNQYSTCQQTYFTMDADPSFYDNAYTPWWEFDTYVETFTEYCDYPDGIYNEALLELYRTLYEQY